MTIQITESWLTDDGLGPCVSTYEEASRITAEHNFPTRPYPIYQVGNSPHHYWTREEAEHRARYIAMMSRDG